MEDNDSVEGAPESQWRLRGRQLATSASPLLLMFVIGLSYFYSVVYIPTEFDNAFWIFPGSALPMILGSLLSGVLMDKFGRKIVIVLSCPLFVAGWLIVGFTDNAPYFTIGRLICSIPIGSISPLAPVYIGEISDPSFRSVLLAMLNASQYFGMLLSANLGLLMDRRHFAWLIAAMSFLGWCTCLACKESPVWSMNTGQSDLEQWVYLRGWTSLNEFRAIERAIKMESEGRLDNRAKCARLTGMFFSRHILWPLAVSCVLFFIWHFSGFSEMAMLVHGPFQVIFLDQGSTTIELAVLTEGLIYFGVTVIGCALVARFPRRTMAMVSVIGASCSLLLISVSFYLITLPKIIGYAFAVCLLILLCIGLSPLSLVFIGELFPRNMRGVGAGLAFAFSWACALVHSKMSMWIVHHWIFSSVAMFHGIVMAVGALFLIWKLPETKDKSLLEIELIFDEEQHESEPVDIEMDERET